MMHWMTPYVGIKHKTGGRERDGLDCWGLVRLVYREVFQIELPLHPFLDPTDISRTSRLILKSAKEDWTEIQNPFDGCVAGLSQGTIIHHVGVAIFSGGTKIVHTMEGFQVVVEPRQTLRFKGFRTIKFYRHRLWPT